LGEKDAANRDLSAFVASHPDSAEIWTTKVDNFLLGKMNDTELLAAMKGSEDVTQDQQQCAAWYYIGAKRLLNGDKSGAAEAFHKSIATNATGRNEYDFSKAELKDLGN
jgi:lipoprotein NlpI